ncbi:MULTISPECIES: quorum-sensing autoinducer 2 sensor kinase/phosphatase LuxQ [unclassified Vibrio]|uniref:quorum-sensing autoinducer 2 sensor kinase/phosphatase LuxQ n=1 Tax=unclassified Vibrio TaxID=2614977 RepID=UPI00136136DF|nr:MULTISPECIES: quorum-sensing autoinducer 2 sensor kinase/phosphatase LuxQ [unclassified Vibrio]NAW60216.1 response regulator [Vibrio sp. V36_P2S2PM302]NAX27247.1 response regulator [Vibrio sp. V38_P2S17PM301]NAX29729.1 response regulator [Vibrio sp. V37_P2S8PM304]
MKFSLKRMPKRNRLAALITRSVFIINGLLILVVLFQNYQVSRQIISQEVARSNQQTSSLVQSFFDFRLTALQVQQDAYSRSDSLLIALRARHYDTLDAFFASIDQTVPELVPDFRFVIQDGKLAWDDANHEFYGIDTKQLPLMAKAMSVSSNWHLSQVPSTLGTRYLMLRKTPIIDVNTGEVMGLLYIGIVLNNNYGLVSTLRDSAKADNVIMSVGSEVIASTITNRAGYSGIDVLSHYSQSPEHRNFVVSKTDLLINTTPTYLSIYTITNNTQISALASSHYFWVAVVLIAIFIFAALTRLWLNKRVSDELDRLMTFTQDAVDNKIVAPSPESDVEEFHQFGQTLELAFKRLYEQERRFEDLFKFSLSPIILWDSDGQVVKMNPAAHSYFDSEDDDTFEQLVSKLMPQIKMCNTGATLTGINLPLGNKVFRWNLSPILIQGKTHTIITQGQDITSLIEAEKQSEAARQEAEESARVRADFLAKMSHELRTPLNGILGVSQLLKSSVRDSDQLEQVNVLCNSGEHLLAVLNDILDFSKIEQGKFHIQKSEFRLVELLTSVEKIFSPLCLEKHIDLKVSNDLSEDVLLFTDQVRLNQVLFNLVSNAVKFTHEGQVHVNVSASKSTQGESLLNIVVEDTGIGVEESQLQSIFDPFVQAESTTTREYGGSGLGLAIVKSLMELLDGEIRVSSQLGLGSRFELVLPTPMRIASSVEESGEQVSDQELLFDRQLKVLLVEDNHTNAFIAQAFCKKYKMEVIWVKDGLAAIEYLKQNPHIDLVLMDNQLPNLGGIEATKMIRDDLNLDIPIYACTADGMMDTKRAFLTAGANYVIVKPIKEKALNQAFVHYKNMFYHG